MPGHFTFYAENMADGCLVFSESEARHMVQVLRFGIGDEIWASDGKGQRFQAVLIDIGKKEVKARITATQNAPMPSFGIAVGILKSTDRMEWMLEKAVELGVGRVVFLNCANSERSKIFLDKLQKTCIAALKQSHGFWLPQLEISGFKEAVLKYKEKAFIAHCTGALPASAKDLKQNSFVFIGPEGDFSEDEIAFAQQNGLRELGLGTRILRTETAAVAACAAANLCG